MDCVSIHLKFDLLGDVWSNLSEERHKLEHRCYRAPTVTRTPFPIKPMRLDWARIQIMERSLRLELAILTTLETRGLPSIKVPNCLTVLSFATALRHLTMLTTELYPPFIRQRSELLELLSTTSIVLPRRDPFLWKWRPRLLCMLTCILVFMGGIREEFPWNPGACHGIPRQYPRTSSAASHETTWHPAG